MMSVGDRLVVVDVGASGGLQGCWWPYEDRIRPVLFEPNPDEAAKVRESLAHIPGSLVVEHGLSSRPGPQTLHIGRHWGCTSLLEADQALLTGYGIAPCYDEIGQATVECERYDTLYRAGSVPAPDAIKIDVEGHEYEVLLGFGALLENCLGLMVEAWIYPVYRRTRLLGDIVAHLQQFGLVLRRFTPIEAFDGDLFVGDAVFTLPRLAVERLDQSRREKFAIMSAAWELPTYRGQGVA